MRDWTVCVVTTIAGSTAKAATPESDAGLQRDAFERRGEERPFFSARYQELGQYNRYDEARNISLYLKNTLSVASWMKLTLGMDTRFNRSEFCQASGMGYTSAMPYDRLYDDDGQPVNRYIYNQVLAEQLATQDGYYDMGFNAAEESKHNIKKTDRQYLKLFLHTDFNITKDLDLELKFQYERNHAETNEYDEENSYMMRSILNEFASRNDDGTLTYHIPRGGHLLTGNTNASYYNLRGQFNYKKNLPESMMFLLCWEEKYGRTRTVRQVANVTAMMTCA